MCLTLTNGEVQYIDNPTNYPDPALIQVAEEPMVKASILSPSDYVGNIMELCQDRRGVFKDMKYLDDTRVELHYELPLNEIVYDFFDVLKSRTKGYASFDYEMLGYVPSKLVKLDILLNGDVVDALSFIVHTDKAYGRARKIAEKLKDNIPRQLFEVPIQAAIGGKIIARETVNCAKVFGVDPKVAFLSYSTLGSGSGEDVDKMHNACAKAKAEMPDIPIDGEFQFDAAVSPVVARTKCPNSPVAGYANTFIFPDINAGNIGYKIAQRLGNFDAYGPILLGLNAQINDLSRGCNAQEVYSMAIITAALA